jgi:hypothetical protein
MELSLKDVKELIGAESKVNPFSRWFGKNVFIRSVTHHYTGKIVELIGDTCAVLDKAAWIADDGRFQNALQTADFSEVELFKNPVGLNWGAVLDITEIGSLPENQK